MEVIIRPAKVSDIAQYTDLLQETYQNAYTNDEIGLTKECFSKEIFHSPDTQRYLASNLEISDVQKSWVAFMEEALVGSITITDKGDTCELRGFYVKPEYQGKGVGKKLWNLALGFAKGKDITLDIYAHNTRTIDMYKKWGFQVDVKRGEFYRHWPEWPEGVRAKCIYMRYKIRK